MARLTFDPIYQSPSEITDDVNMETSGSWTMDYRQAKPPHLNILEEGESTTRKEKNKIEVKPS